ncbi:MAG: chromosome segregation protein SMC [Geobacter sp.]|nr:chromosome segregation protein SMC [Geobacter sp.]
MKIKRLEISGFKSFVEKASFDFPAGVTAVVGPNGCGKSNVVDAIRWVMGEQSAKNLRGRAMEDVIFGGSESRKPLGMAEVSLIFSTDDGRVPAKYLNYSEVQVTRRLYRDGESEYLLNRTPCRLMDITELFMDTGVGTRAYSIIEQGRIGMILMAKPEERRFLIEEAAGVTKYKSRKQIALKKIEATRQNLLRIGDVVGEVKRQLGSLHRQAKRAEKFRAVREEQRGIELFFATRRYFELSAQRELSAGEVAKTEQSVVAAAGQLQAKEVAIDAMRLALLDGEKGLTAFQEEIFRSRGELQAAENRLEYQRKEVASLESQSAKAGEELLQLQKQIADADAEKALLELRGREYFTDSLGGQEALELKERQLDELAATERAAAASLEESRKRLFSLVGEITQAANQQSTATRRLEMLSERIARSASEEAGLKTSLLQAQERSALFGEKLGQEKDRFAALTASIAEISASLDKNRAELAAVELELQKSRSEQSSVTSRLNSLQELEAQFAGYGQGLRNLMLADGFKSRFNGVLADSLEVDEELEAAVEAVLGSRLQALLAGDEESVHAAVRHLKNSGGGRCGFMLQSLPGRKPLPAPAGTEPLLSRLKIPESHSRLCEALLHGVMLAPDLETAITLARQHPENRFVTLHGDLAYGGGMVTAGSKEQAQQGLIHKKREIRVLAARKIACDQQTEALVAARSDLSRTCAEAEQKLQGLKQEHRLAELQVLAHEKDLQRSREEVHRLEERLVLKGHEDAQVLEEKEHLHDELVESGARKQASELLKTGIENEIATIQNDLAARRREMDAVRGEVTAMKVAAAALKEKQESARTAIARVEALATSLQEKLQRQQEEANRCRDALVKLKEEAGEAEKQLNSMTLEQAAKESQLQFVRAAYDEDSARLRGEEALLKALKEEEESCRRQASEAVLRHSTLELELENTSLQLRDRFRMNPAELPPPDPDVAFDEEQMSARLESLQKQVEDFGEVNLTAIEEYQELDERHNFLAAQKADLEESLNSLQQAIQRINRTTRKRFAETFELVNEKFKDVFPRLFCGGKAELKLTNEDDMLETGLDIIVQPPGKKLQNVSLLSGGEKALTAVALIFSIFLIKPSPFCLLDEVDAPLDDANIGRFNEMIREMSAFSQFILITHSKTTMAVADTLYGVTMEEPGVSKLVSVKLQ